MVSIIILSFNTQSLLRECLESIFSVLTSLPFEVIVFDNASKDESVSMVKKEFSKVHVIESEENLGFAKGVNEATKKAKGDYFLFLNSDAELLDGNISRMIKEMENDEKIGAIGGNLLQKDTTTSEPYGRFYNLPEVMRFLFFAEKATVTVSNEVTKVDWVSGGFMLVRRSIFEKLHGFDEGYFMYIEDMDLCYRMKKAGFRVMYFPQAKARHVGQGSSNRTFAIVQIYKGLLHFYKKQKPRWQYFVVKLLLVVKALGALVVGILKGNAYLKTTYAQAIDVIL